ncbi:histidinol-phosphate transaminase [Entomophthora muscae]|uniref:Histidinol-phosphate transaminase n=1 Tax=Entomophthora muscae TaxID=34485 RepID=A0ACC2U9Z2_9FUNG|nr:histidinol-phosphate transaminase [Entomophthora muscae]
MQTLSKSFGLAGIRLGVGFSSPEIIQIMNNTKAPYNISSLTSQAALDALSDTSISKVHTSLESIKYERKRIAEQLTKLEGMGDPLGQPDANFLLIPILGYASKKPSNLRAKKVYLHLAEQLKIVIRYRAEEVNCQGCLRMTVGTPEENSALVEGLKQSLEKFQID